MIGPRVWGQSWIARSYTVQDGLPHSTVFCSYQDEEGLIWFGTDNGLASFDGQGFMVWRGEDGLLGPHITGITQDKSGILWAGSYRSGINQLKHGRILPVDSAKQTFSFGYDLLRIKDNLYSCTTSFIVDYADSGRVHTYLRPLLSNESQKEKYGTSFSHYGNISGPYGQDSSLLIGSLAGHFTYRNGELASACPEAVFDMPVYSISNPLQNSYWIGSMGKMLKLQNCRIIEEITEGLPKDEYIHRILEDAKGNCWIAVHEYGLYFLRNGEKRAEFLGERLNIGHVDINYLMEDREENIWISTMGHGLVMTHYSDFESIGEGEGLAGHVVTAFGQTPAGLVYIGTQSGLFVETGESFEMVELFSEPGSEYTYDLSYSSQLGMIVSARLASAPRDEYVQRISPDLLLIQAFSSLTLDNDYLLYPNNQALSPLTISKISNTGDLTINRKVSFPGEAFDKPFKIQKLFQDGEGKIWIATKTNGLFMLPSIDGDIKEIRSDSLIGDGIQMGSIHDFLFLSDSLYWIATENGLVKWESEVWTFYYESDGLGDNYCSSLAYDSAGVLWIGTAGGLSYYQDGRIVTLDGSDGLSSPEVSALLYDSLRNCLWVGTGNGAFHLSLSSFTPKQMMLDPPNIHRVESLDSVYMAPDRLFLEEEESDVRIHFNTLYYRNPDRVEYQYRLSPRQTAWSTTKNPQIEYAALADGQYTFQVRSSIQYGIWSSPTSLTFQIRPPFWKTPGFYALMALALILIVILIAWLRITGIRRREKEKRALLTQINTLEQQALAALMNPHFIFNALNSIQHYLHLNEQEAANEYLVQFARLIRMNMEIAAQASTPLDEELDRLKLYLSLEQLRFGDSLSYEIHIDPSLDLEDIELPSMIIQPFVENAIWHGILPAKRPGHLLLLINSLGEDGLAIKIKDNGVGISQKDSEEQASTHISRGMSITRERLRLYSLEAKLEVKAIHDESDRIAGTVVDIYLPID